MWGCRPQWVPAYVADAGPCGGVPPMGNFPTPRFSLNMGAAPPLFYVAINYRNIAFRTEAITLILAGPRREGIWDGLVAAEVAREHVDGKYSNISLLE